MTQIIEVEHLYKDFTTPTGRQVPVLQDISLSVSEREIVVILGQSGCGKSTLLRIVAGLIAPTKGALRYRGSSIDGANPGVAMVFQTFALLPWLTVEANVELGLKARAVSPAKRQQLAHDIIDKIGLSGFESTYPRELSGGMCQRVDFARALVVQPDVLLMDEPFSALDVLTAANLRNDLLTMWAHVDFPTKAIVMVTHNIEEAVQMADHIVLLSPNAGKQHDITNELPRPRDRRSSEFQALSDYLYDIMTGHTEAEMKTIERAMARPEGASPRELPLPNATAGGLAGLLGILHARGGQADAPELATRLRLEVNDLLPLVNGAEILGFVQVDKSDIALTPTGKEFVEADVRTSKKLFAEQACRRAPLVRTISRALSDAPEHRLTRKFFLDLLEHDFTREKALQQLRVAMDWGLYGELYRYEAHNTEIALTPDSPPSSAT